MNNLPVVRSPWRILILVLGFTFLYAPMLMLVIYSFNSSKLVTVWAGWSTRWLMRRAINALYLVR